MKKRLSHAALYELFRGLALLLHAGIPLADGAYLLAQEAPTSRAALLRELGARLDGGESLSQAMEALGVFPAGATGLVRVGERSGHLEQALEALAAEHERRDGQEARLRTALSYPALLLGLILLVLGVLLTEVLPVFDRVYASLGSGLTGVAGGLLRLGQWLKAALPWLGSLLGVLVLAVLLLVYHEGLRGAFVKWWQRHFGGKGAARALADARFAAALAMALQSGMQEEEALALAGELLTDSPAAYRQALDCRSLLKEGHSLPQALGESGAMPSAECRLLELGLRGGKGDEVAREIARRLDEQARLALERTLGRIEPAMVLCAAVLVGLILLAVMLPLLEILTVMG